MFKAAVTYTASSIAKEIKSQTPKISSVKYHQYFSTDTLDKLLGKIVKEQLETTLGLVQIHVLIVQIHVQLKKLFKQMRHHSRHLPNTSRILWIAS